ncbi:ABC transporter ATP-binding protein, partial [Oenococcus oeni]
AMGYLAFNFSVGNTLCWVIAFTFPFSFGRVLALANLPSSLGNALLSAKNIFKILDEKAVSNLSENQEISLIKQSRFVDVNFSYPLRPNKTVLKDASLIGKKSEVIGIIGESGERKSALMKLLMKWYQPKKGLIEVYNHDLRKIKKSGLRKQINYVAQNPLILSGTIRENITLKNNSFSDSKIWESLKKVELDKTVKKMPKELDTKISRLEQRFFFRRIAKTGNCQSIAVPEFNIDFRRTDKQLGHP